MHVLDQVLLYTFHINFFICKMRWSYPLSELIMKAFDKWSTIQTTHLGEYWMLSADISKFAEIFPICSQGRELLEYVPLFSCPLNKQHWIIFSLSLMTIFYFESILTAFIFCSSTVFWKFTCHFLCRTGLWCLDIWAGNYGEFKMEYNHSLKQYSFSLLNQILWSCEAHDY